MTSQAESATAVVPPLHGGRQSLPALIPAPTQGQTHYQPVSSSSSIQAGEAGDG